nr:mucin-2 isoform X4 [Misgurnus anguillicaudatus]
MDVGWKRVHLLIFFLTFWKHAVGRDSLDFQNVNPHSLHFPKTYSPPEVQSSMLNASVTRNIPHEEVDSNVLGGNGTGPSRSLFSYLQFIKEGAPSGYASLSQAQSASSSSVSTSLTAPQNLSQSGSFSTLFQVQGSSTSNVKVMAGQSVGGTGYHQYDSTSKDSTGLNTGGSIQLVSSTGGSGLSQSSFSQYAPGFSPLSYSPTVLSQSGSKTLNTSSQSSSGTLMGGLSSRLFTLTSQGSSRPQVTQGGSTSFSGLFQQSPSKSQSSLTYSHPGSLPLAGSRYPTSSQSLFSSGSQGSSSYQLAASRPSGLAQGSSSQPGVSYVQSQGRLGQLAIGSPQYGSVSLASPQVPQNWLPSSFSPGSQTSGTVVSQSSYSPQSAPAPSKPLSSVGRPSQVAPGLLYSSASLVPQKWLPSASFSPGSQTSGTVVSQSSYSPQSAPAPSKPLSSVGRPSQVAPGLLYPSASLASPQVPQNWLPSSFSPGSQTSGTVVSQSSYSPQSAPAPSKPLSSVGRPSQVAPGLLYSSASLVPQKWLPSASFSPGSQTSGTVVSQSSYSPQSAPAPSKPLSSVGRPSQVAPGLLYPSASLASPQVPQNWLPSSFSPGSQTSGTVVSQSSYSPQSAPAPSKPLSSVGRPSQVAPSLLSSDPSTLSLQSGVGTVQTVSSHYVLPQKGTLSTFSSSLQSQVASRPYGPAPSLDAKVPIYSQTHPAGTMYQSQPSRFWQPSTSKASGSFSTSDATVLQSSSSSQSVQASSRFSSAGGASYPVSTQGGGSYSGVSLYPGTVLQYPPVAPASGVFSSSPLSVSSQSASGQSSPSKHSSLSQSQTGSRLTSSGYLSVPGGSGSSDGSSLLTQGTLGKYAPVPSMDTPLPASSQTKAVSSGVSLSQSQPLQSWQPSATGWHQVIQASGSAPLQSGSSQSAQTSGTISFQPASSVPVDSVAQSGQTPVSRQTSSLLGFGSRPSRLLSIASSGSVSNQMSPDLSASLKLPTGSMTPGSTAPGVSVSSQAQPLTDPVKYDATVGGQGLSSGLSSVLYSRYGSSSQSGPVSSSPVSGSAGSQVPPSVFASLKLPTGSMTPGLTAPGVSVSSQAQPLTDPVKYDATVGGQGVSSGLSSVLYSRYGSSSQSGPVSSSPVSGSAGSQVPPSVFASLKLPTGSMTPGLTAPGVSVSSQAQPLTDPVKYDAAVGGQGVSSGLSSVLYSRYGSSSQSGPVSGSAGSQVSPSVFASLKLPTGSMIPGLTAPGVSVSSQAQPLTDPVKYDATVGGQGVPSGLSVLYSRYGSSSQSGPVSGSAGSQVPPSLFASLKLPTGSMTPGLTAPGVSVSSQAQPLTDPVKYGASVGGQGLSSGLSSVLYSRYGSSSQSGQVSSSPVSGSAGSQVSPSVFASLKLPTGSITRGSTSQTASGGMSSAPPQALGDTYGASVGGQGMSSGSVSSGFTSVSSSYGSFYGQNDPLSKPSQVSFSQYNAVKG